MRLLGVRLAAFDDLEPDKPPAPVAPVGQLALPLWPQAMRRRAGAQYSRARRRACGALRARAGASGRRARRARRRRPCAARPCARSSLGRDRRDQRVQARARSRPRRAPRTPRASSGSSAEAQARGQAVGGERAGDVGQQLQRLLAVARGGQQARERDRGVGAAGLELQRAAQVGLAALGDQRVGLGRDDAVEEALDLRAAAARR